MTLANTKQLFLDLLPKVGVNCVCDVGSMNGAESLAFHSVLPNATAFAFEANPVNVSRMQANKALQDAGIQIVPMAVTNFDGETSFFVVQADDAAPEYRRGMSSLYQRSDPSIVQNSVRVATTRLDTFLRARKLSNLQLGVWLDVEGKAYEALEGASSVLDCLRLLHVEVETRPCIGTDQKLENDVRKLLVASGLRELASDSDENPPQLNLVFIKADLPSEIITTAMRIARRANARFRLRRRLRALKARFRGRP